MPELPEVETVRRGLQPVMEGSRVLAVEARRPDLRFPLPENFAERLSGRRIVSLLISAILSVWQVGSTMILMGLSLLPMSASLGMPTARPCAVSLVPGQVAWSRSRMGFRASATASLSSPRP